MPPTLPAVDILTGQLAPRSRQEYAREVAAYQRFCDGSGLGALDAGSLARWGAQLTESSTLSPNTINRKVAAVKTLVRLGTEQGYVDVGLGQAFAAVRGVKPAALKHRLKTTARTRISAEQMRQLCQAPEVGTLRGLRDRALLATLASSGCRISEVVSLTTLQLQAEAEFVFIEVCGKHQVVPRQAPLGQEAYQHIGAWLTARPLASPVVFTRFERRSQLSTEPLSRQAAWRLVKRYAEAVGLAHVKPHDFRRFVGTQLAKRDIRQAQKALGHRRIETTAKHYVLDDLAGGLTDHLY